MHEQSISVAIASYNGGRYIEAQLQSIIGQTQRPDEIIVADDGSTDRTREIVRNFSDRSPVPIRLIEHARNIGIFENFMSAFAACQGRFIYYCDQDDVWRADKIEIVQQHFAAGTALVMHSSEIVDEALRPLGRTEVHNPYYGRLKFPVDTLITYGFGHQMAFLNDVRSIMSALRTAAVTAGEISFGNCYDSLIPFSASILGDIAVLNEPLTKFRRHAQATTGAGLDTGERADVRHRARHVLERRTTDSASYIAVLSRAIADGLIGPEGLPIMAALHRQHHRAAGGHAIGQGPIVRRAQLAPGVLASALRRTGFSNDRRLHDLVLAGIAATA